MTRFVITSSAKVDISKTLDYLERTAGRATAARYSRRFQAAVDRLLVFPESGAPRPLLGGRTRVVVIYPYLMFYDYQAVDGQLAILRVLHGKMAITEEILRRG